MKTNKDYKKQLTKERNKGHSLSKKGKGKNKWWLERECYTRSFMLLGLQTCSMYKEISTLLVNNNINVISTTQNKWIGLLHHICNDHYWPGGSCDHGDMPEDHSLSWFDRRSKDFETLQKIILDPALQESFKFYIKFR